MKFLLVLVLVELSMISTYSFSYTLLKLQYRTKSTFSFSYIILKQHFAMLKLSRILLRLSLS